MDDLANKRTGKSTLRMPPSSYVYQYVSQGLLPETLYVATLRARVSDRTLNVPLVASIRFFNEVGVQVGYTTQIIIDDGMVDLENREFKISAEAPKGCKTASIVLSVEESGLSDDGNSYLIDEVTFAPYHV